MTFCDELPLNKPCPTSIQTFTDANKFLGCGQQIHSIMGDVNCLFQALSYLLCGHEDHHLQIRHTIVDFTTTSQNTFSKYCTLNSFEEHTSHMKHGTFWGTDLELHVAASYFQLPICMYTEKQNLEYYWECYRPLSTLISPKGTLH